MVCKKVYESTTRGSLKTLLRDVQKLLLFGHLDGLIDHEEFCCFLMYIAAVLCLITTSPGGGTPLCDLNGNVQLDRVWFSGCFVLKRVSISMLSVLNRVSLHYLMA